MVVYEVGKGVLSLRNHAVLESIHGRLEGEQVRVDRTERVLAAGGRWKMVIPLKEDAREAVSKIGEGGLK